MRAPLACAYSIACTAWKSVLQDGSSLMNFRAMILTDGATPAMPVPLPDAAIDPATCVPW